LLLTSIDFHASCFWISGGSSSVMPTIIK